MGLASIPHHRYSQKLQLGEADSGLRANDQKSRPKAQSRDGVLGRGQHAPSPQTTGSRGALEAGQSRNRKHIFLATKKPQK